MRKIITFLTICALTSFSFMVKGQLVELNAQTSVSGDPSTLLVGQATIKNTSSDSVSVKAQVITNNLASGHQSYFCVGATCYPPGTSSSPVFVLAPDSSTLFLADADPKGTNGTDSVRYLIYNIKDSANDKISISFNYDFATGIKALNPAAGSFLNCSQSNTEDVSNITYRINNFKDGELVIMNLMGAIEKEIKLNDVQGVLSVSTINLSPGIYMYALYNNNEAVAIKKVVIWHR